MKSFTKKVLRKSLDSFFDRHGKVVAVAPAIEHTMVNDLGVMPQNYSQACDQIRRYLALKVEQGYLVKSTGRMGGYQRVSDWSKDELAHQASERDKWNRGCEIKHGIIAGLEAQIIAVKNKSPSDFI